MPVVGLVGRLTSLHSPGPPRPAENKAAARDKGAVKATVQTMVRHAADEGAADNACMAVGAMAQDHGASSVLAHWATRRPLWGIKALVADFPVSGGRGRGE